RGGGTYKEAGGGTAKMERGFAQKNRRPGDVGVAGPRRCRTISEASSSRRGPGPTSMGIAGALFAIAAAAIVAAWDWLGASVQMPPSPLASGEKLYCVSYSPFRGTQSPLGPEIPV